MSRPPKTDFLAIARASWGADLPDWIEQLAQEATRTSGAAVAMRLGYTAPVISGVIRRSYAGDLIAVEQKFRGAFMGATVECPVLSEIGRDRCLEEQKKNFIGTSAVRTKLFRACRSGCPHSRLTKSSEVENV